MTKETAADPIQQLLGNSDFMPASKTYGAGGMNQFFVDSTAVTNIPNHPEDGKPMVCRWIYPSDINKYKLMGWEVVPPRVLSTDVTPEGPMVVHSASARPSQQGLIERDGGFVCLVWTRPKNYDALQAAVAKKALDQKYGDSRPGGDGEMAPRDGKIGDGDWSGGRTMAPGFGVYREEGVETETVTAGGMTSSKTSTNLDLNLP